MISIDPKDDEDRSAGNVKSEPESDDGPRVSRMRVGDEEIIVLSVPLPTLRYPEGTTGAEQEIIDLVLQGFTVKEIAERRGASFRTVTTQLGTIFRKAGVNSQAELIAALIDGYGDAEQVEPD
ncbi:MAG: helix-turn-helix transcriptional regulator [Myxococcales bacterium]|jgi:DNA-binding NarL/FixJ family response regulator